MAYIPHILQSVLAKRTILQASELTEKTKCVEKIYMSSLQKIAFLTAFTNWYDI